VDSATILYGSLLWARKGLEGGMHLDPLTGSARLLERLRIFDTGAPAEPTGQVVAAVRSRMDADPLRYEDLFDRIERLTWGLRQELARGEESPSRLVALLRQAHACLVELGVVPESVQALVAAIEEHGGGAKISGAGSLSGPGAGCLVVYHPEPESLAGLPALAALAPLPLRLGGPGMRLEAPVPSSRPSRGEGGGR
jgi:mevalonate kinase